MTLDVARTKTTTNKHYGQRSFASFLRPKSHDILVTSLWPIHKNHDQQLVTDQSPTGHQPELNFEGRSVTRRRSVADLDLSVLRGEGESEGECEGGSKKVSEIRTVVCVFIVVLRPSNI